MKALGLHNWFGAVLVTAIAYALIGFGTAALAGSAHSIQTRTFWRMAAWSLGLIAFALAVGGPAASHWSEVGFWRAAALSVVLWPILMGVPSFFVALVAASIFGRVLAREKPAASARVG